MKPVVTRLYAILVVLCLVGLAAWTGADWYQQQQKALVRGQTVLRQAAGRISDLSLGPDSPTTLDQTRILTQGPGLDGRWKVLLLTSVEQGVEYYRGPRPEVPVDKAVPRWEPRPLAEVKVVLPVFRATGSPMTLEGIYEFYGRTEVFALLQAGGFTLLGLLILTTLLVVLTARGPGSRTSVSDGDAETQEPPPEPAPADAFDFSTLPDEEPLGPVDGVQEDEYWFDDGPDLDDLPPLDPPSEEPFAAPTAQGGEDPSLFSPDSGLGWQSFLVPRLENELDRAAGMNQDLALVLLAPREPVSDPQAWGRAVREAFPSADLDFEHEGGAAVVLPGKTLEQALKSARAFVESADRRLDGLTVHAGVAARAGRLLSAQVLLDEAASARRRSLAGTVRVLGLKTDPDRWREHLSRPA